MLLVCCQSNLYEQIAVGEPIMPVRMHSDSAEIVLTDYVPTLIGSNVERLARMSVMSIENDGRISEIPFTDGKTSFSIVVLPNKPFRTGLITTGSERHKVSIQLPSEEAQIVADDSELIDLTEFWWKGSTPGFAGSCGLLDERIRLYAIERDVTREQLDAMNGKNQTYVEENEWIRTEVLPYEEAAHKFVDGKNLIALFLYERWLETRM